MAVGWTVEQSLGVSSPLTRHLMPTIPLIPRRYLPNRLIRPWWTLYRIFFFPRPSRARLDFKGQVHRRAFEVDVGVLFSVGDHNVSVFFFPSLSSRTVLPVHLVPPDVWRRPTFLKNLLRCRGKDGQVILHVPLKCIRPPWGASV